METLLLVCLIVLLLVRWAYLRDRLEYIEQRIDVLTALVTITGQNFGYDQRAWATWYRNQKAKGLPVEAKKS